MRRIEPQHQAVEKAPPAARAFDEEPVHLRRQPQDAEPLAERRLAARRLAARRRSDRKSTRLNSSHTVISYAVFCLKKKKTTPVRRTQHPSTCTGLTRP